MTDVTERGRTKRELERLATHDRTTALPNRQVVKRRLDRTIARAGRTGTDLAVLSIDLDPGKEVNDRFGHEVGDALLRAVAARLAEVCRGNDLVARFGGDAFVVVMEDRRDFPLDEIKIDKSFAARIGVDERADLIVTAIARMARRLRIETVGEGVEYPRQAAFVRRLAVRRARGSLFSRPVPAETADAPAASGHAPPRR